MSNVDDLLDPLRFNNLGSFELTDVRSIGGGVYAEKNTLEHLKTLDLVVKAYQSVHAPTFGRLIPNTQEIIAGNLATADFHKVLTPSVGQVIEVQAIDALANTSGTEISVYIGDSNTGGKVLLASGSTIGALPSGTTISLILFEILPLTIAYGQDLIIEITSSGSVDLDIQMMTIKKQQ
jgi:hypothetical protein